MLLVGLILQINEEPRLNYLIQNLATLYPGMKAVSSNASPDWAICFMGVVMEFF